MVSSFSPYNLFSYLYHKNKFIARSSSDKTSDKLLQFILNSLTITNFLTLLFSNTLHKITLEY
ncbi:hypothetical protein SPYSS1447_0581 [Streptococcus pyogenes SS1447]|nr:hypothetical protein SPYSS1447_0581 [Streptococcus pyogenes SS1447]